MTSTRPLAQITVAARTTLDADTIDSYMVTVTATDPWGAAATPTGAIEEEVTITINGVNEAPAITAGVTKTAVDENTPIATADSTYMATDVDQEEDVPLIWTVSGTDEGDFEISNEAGTLGQLTFKKLPDYEKPVDSNMDNVYMVTVVATDAGVNSKNKMTAERAVVVTVMNVEEDGTVTLSSVQPKVGVELTAEVTDLDGGVKDVTWRWHRNTDGTADVDAEGWLLIEDAKSKTYTPVADDAVVTVPNARAAMFLRATAMYTDDTGMGTAVMVSANEVIVDQANKAPEFRAGGVDNDVVDTAADSGGVVTSAKRSILENVPPDTSTPATTLPTWVCRSRPMTPTVTVTN